MAVAGGLVLVCALFHAWREPTTVLTAIGGQPPLAPLYAILAPVFRPAAGLAVVVLGFGLWLQLRGPRSVAAFLLLALVFSFAFRVSVHTVRDPSLPGRELGRYPGEAVLYDVARIRSISGFLDGYAALQPDLSLHGRTKPPGYALLLHGATFVLGRELTALGMFFTLVASAIVVPAWLVGRHLGGPHVARDAALLSAVAPSAVLYGAVTLDATFAVLAGFALALALAEVATPNPARRAALGATLSLAAMLSYSAALVGLLCGVVLLFRGDWPASRRARALAEVGVAFLLPLVVLAALTGFDPLQTFANARTLNRVAMTAILGRDVASFSVWSYAALGNALAFLAMLGAPIVAGLFALRGDRLPAPARGAAVAFVLTLAIACFGGLYLMETERTLLFLVAPAAALARLAPGFDARVAVGLCGLQAVICAGLLETIW